MSKLSKDLRKRQSLGMEKPKVSIVIRAKNEEQALPKLFEKIKSQTFKDWEVILVDDHSNDKTAVIAHDFGATVILLNEKFTYGGSLNKGIENSRGEFVISIAAHAIPVNDKWLEDFLKCIQADEKLAGVYGGQIAGKEATIYEKLERFINNHFDFNRLYPYFLNTNSIFRRNVWDKVQFDPSVWGLEDSLWCRKVSKLGYRFALCQKATVYHNHDKNLLASATRFYRELKVYTGILLGRYN